MTKKPKVIKNSYAEVSGKLKSSHRALTDYYVLALQVEAFIEDIPQKFEDIKTKEDKKD